MSQSWHLHSRIELLKGIGVSILLNPTLWNCLGSDILLCILIRSQNMSPIIHRIFFRVIRLSRFRRWSNYWLRSCLNDGHVPFQLLFFGCTSIMLIEQEIHLLLCYKCHITMPIWNKIITILVRNLCMSVEPLYLFCGNGKLKLISITCTAT